MHALMEAKKIAILEGIRKAKGRTSAPKKDETVTKPAITHSAPRSTPLVNMAAKRAAAMASEITPKRPAIPSSSSARPLVNNDNVSDGPIQLPTDRKVVVEERSKTGGPKILWPKQELPVEAAKSKLAKKEPEGVMRLEETSEVVEEKPLKKRLPQTENGQWSVFGCSSLIYDFEHGVAFSDERIQENMTKMAKNNRSWSHRCWLDKASTYHGHNPDLEELYVANAMMTIKFNELVNKNQRGPQNIGKLKQAVCFDLTAAKESDEPISLPSKLEFKITDLVDTHLIQQMLYCDVDQLTRKLMSKVLEFILEHDFYSVGYSAPIGRPTGYISLGARIPQRVAKIIAAGLKWNEDKLNMEEGRIMMLGRSMMENALSKHRKRFNTQHGCNAAKIVAQNLIEEDKQEMENETIEQYQYNVEEENDQETVENEDIREEDEDNI